MPDHKKSYAKKLEYNNAYNRQNYRSFSIRYNIEQEADIISWLESQKSLKKYISDLIMKDIQGESKEEKKPEKEKKKKDKNKDSKEGKKDKSSKKKKSKKSK
ncbi:MAG: hypothetical protein E7190_03935 [Erysipelotrichaceae bacterium]|nr:hypothetical protein [Erysipelotrichaceae bacterium]